MNNTQFLVAKYTPDLRRSEPRNFGVIVWSRGHVAARFAGEAQSTRGITPPRHLHINSKDAYRKWVRYWRELIEMPALRGDDGLMIGRDEAEFIDALQAKSKPQYRLVRGGEFLKEVKPSELDEVAEELFEELVSIGGVTEPDEHVRAARLLSRSCKKAIEDSGLKDRPGFRDGFPWICDIAGRKVPFHFDYAIHYDVSPLAVMDRVNLWKPDHVYSTAYEFNEMRKTYNIPKEDCVALIYPTPQDVIEEKTRNLWAMLGDIATVVDMRDPKAAAFRFQSLGTGSKA